MLYLKNVDVTNLVIAPREPTRCNAGCGALLSLGQEVHPMERLLLSPVYHVHTYARSVRSGHSKSYAFCSAECRTEWWTRASSELFFPVANPDQMEWVTCEKCPPGQARLECPFCYGAGTWSKNPDFLYSDSNTIGWRSEWAVLPFDVDIHVLVVECDSSMGAVGEDICTVRVFGGYTDKFFAINNVDLIVDWWQFANPIELNAWWRKGETREEFARGREEFRVLSERNLQAYARRELEQLMEAR